MPRPLSILSVVQGALLCSGCQSSSASTDGGTIACKESLDDYCADAFPKCVRRIDLAQRSSFCEQVGTSVSYSQEYCPKTGALGVVFGPLNLGTVFVMKTYLYDGTSGNLIAVLDGVTDETVAFGACVGGPVILADSGACVDDAIGVTCYHEGGASPNGVDAGD